MPLGVNKGTLSVGEAVNISNNPGYDNQPSFYNDNVVVFASTRSTQTDIAGYAINSKEKSWISDTPGASEYSPLKVPGKKQISAIRLEKDGLQRLYSYPFEKGKPKELLPDLKVGYHVWYSKDMIICTVLVEDRMDLVVADLKTNNHYTVYKNVGRSLHKIPNSQLVSFISREGDSYTVKSLNPVSGASQKITELPDGVQDYCWLLNGTLLLGKSNQLLGFRHGESTEWEVLHNFKNPDIGKISRVAVNSLSTQLALVAEASPAVPVQMQHEAYNAGDIEAFLEQYDENVKVYDYPDKFLYEGKETMKKRYSLTFRINPDLQCELKKRIVLGNKVIDEETVTANGMLFHTVTIYEIINGKITRVTFMQ
ncbi:MAG: SnoaL-like domain-containing protein [Eudoraea sp.]|nr:nuclear transport factor 2 family protein [Eudoraea sp.]NNJ41381.1 SnoaL-like domain-containing protein [Eudoraea sp.]